MPDEETVVTLHVETAPYPQTITAPCCGEEMTVYISERTNAVTCDNGCGWIEYIHDRQGGDESEDSTEQIKLVTDGGETVATRRCHHCGMPQDRDMLDGSCPHCMDIYPDDDPHPNNATRCDGCGHSRAESACKTIRDDEEAVIGTYCRGCREILDDRGLDAGDHEQHQLMEGRHGA